MSLNTLRCIEVCADMQGGVQACHSVCGGQRKSSYVGPCLQACLRKGLCASLQPKDFPNSVSHFSLDMLEL